MRQPTPPNDPLERGYYRTAFIVMLVAVLIVRVLTVRFGTTGLHGDEAQYWMWSRDLDWGYFSKPPLIAWVIATSTSLFGHAEWGVRMIAPFLNTLSAVILFLIGRRLYSPAAGYWSAALFLLMPGIWMASYVISTDTPLLLCWAAALYALIRLRERPDWIWALALGIALGFGLLAKYAMLFFLIALAAAFLVDRPARRALLHARGALAGAAALLVFAPNIIWNFNNGLSTVTHTAANAAAEGTATPLWQRLGWLGEFWLSQFLVFGLVAFALLLVALWLTARGQTSRDDRLLGLFVLVPLLLISVQAWINGANANWAATAYVAAAPLTARYIVSSARLWGRIAYIVNVGIGVIFCLVMVIPDLQDRHRGLANAMKWTQSWPETTDIIREAYAAGTPDGEAFTTIATDHRETFFDLYYYSREAPLPLTAWRLYPEAHNHAEAEYPLETGEAGPVLVVNLYPVCKDELESDFERLEKIRSVEVPLGAGKVRSFDLWAGYGFNQTPRAQPCWVNN